MLFLFMLLREKDQKVLYSFEMLLLSEKLFQKYRSAALMIQIVNIDKSEDVSVFLRVGKKASTVLGQFMRTLSLNTTRAKDLYAC